jgi:NAD(P)-dependent dehydrogenase (short-subunit alcohol dehydrogenase family)
MQQPWEAAIEQRSQVAIATNYTPLTSAQMVSLKRNGLPEDIAGAILLLASDEARFITGHICPLVVVFRCFQCLNLRITLER